MCTPGYHNTDCVATRTLVHTMYDYTLLVFKNQKSAQITTRATSKIIQMVEYGSRYTKSVQEITRTTSIIHVIKKPNVHNVTTNKIYYWESISY